MHFRQVSLCAIRPLSLRKKASSCFLFSLILGTDIPPFCHPADALCRTAKYGRVSVSFFTFLARLNELFWPQILSDRVSTACEQKTLFGRVSVSFLNNLSGLLPESGRMRIVRSPFQSLFSHESSFHFILLRSNTTNGEAGNPAGIFLLCCVSLSSGRYIY